LRPDLLWAIGIVFVRQNEVSALGSLAFVFDFDFEFVAGLGGGRERDSQLVVVGFEFGRRFVQRHTLYREADGIEPDFLGVFQNRKTVRDVADNLSLFDVELQDDLRVLQVVIAAARERLIGASRNQPDHPNKNQR
jgi:hypothetical protein